MDAAPHRHDWTTWINVAGSVASLIALGYIWHLFGDAGSQRRARNGLGRVRLPVLP
jgi:hypothetical protein